jgi:hypothetical protein
MLIAHLPAGYLLGRLVQRCSSAPRLLTAALVGSMAPDFDIAYFLTTGGHTHHHAYATHWPLFWVIAAAGTLPILRIAAPRYMGAGMVFFAAALLHMAMDTVAAPIYWFAPFSWHPFEFVTVPASHGSWIVSFMLHWTFLLEIGIWCAAIFVFLSKHSSSRQRTRSAEALRDLV